MCIDARTILPVYKVDVKFKETKSAGLGSFSSLAAPSFFMSVGHSAVSVGHSVVSRTARSLVAAGRSSVMLEGGGNVEVV